ncbi:MAG TPA: hypothetical protein VF794_02140 [Archangium sp.]|uniref:hypothetical protein n=1 Tax=Archangium sp. TaxID=1872627 RepID=UPI002EDA5899
MRERLALLALLLCAGPVGASTVVEANEEPSVPGYQLSQGQTLNMLTEGELRASLTTGVLRPSRGYIPVEVSLHNTGPTPRVVRIDVESHGANRSATATREVEVGPRQRLVAWLPVPISSRGGRVSLRGQDFATAPFTFYSVDAAGAAVLVLGSESAFHAGTDLPRVEKDPTLSVRLITPENAPRELAAYVGHAGVVVASDVTALPADAWSALEAYAATGGHLSLLRPPRDVGERLPLLTGTTPGDHPYGFGRVRLCDAAKECGAGLLSDTIRKEGADENPVGIVSPIGPPPSWQRGGRILNDGAQPLLPGVQAPVGRFLLLITLFVLAVGPGGLALARRKGPVAVLIAVPSVALVTCLAIVAWSVLVEGFSLHAARYGVTLLDRARDRALTVGLNAYYANLEPEGVRLPTLGALLGPDVDWDAYAMEADWTNGMVVGAGFLPSRTYREWGEVAVVPTRARLTVRREGQSLRVRNALGARLVEGSVRFGDQVWTLPALAEGAEGLATPVESSAPRKSLAEVRGFPAGVEGRFSRMPWDTLSGPLPEGGFMARLEGPGMMPTAALPVELHEGLHFVVGRVDGP